MAVSLLPRWLLLALSLALVACGGSGSSEPQLTELSGFVVNGVLAGATVTIRDENGELVGESTTNNRGRFDAELSRAEAPFLLEAKGGTLDGSRYTGTLKAWCPKPEKDGPLRCDVTPYTTLLVYLMEQRSISYAAALQTVQAVLQLDQDPFVQEMQTGVSVGLDRFDLDAARQQINGGAGLADWVDDFATWVLEPDTAPLPAGSPTFVIRLNTGPGGAGAPAERTLSWGGIATFTLTPNTNFEVVSATGCGGQLSEDGTVYTTAPVKGVGPVSGVCAVKVDFALKRYDVIYKAEKVEGKALATDISVTSGSPTVTTTGDFTDRGTDDFIKNGDVLSLDGVQYTVLSVTSATTLSFTVPYVGPTGTVSAANAIRIKDAGIIEGNANQRVAHGSGSSPVTAVANEGYKFVDWSDGKTDPERVDADITQDSTWTARFEINPYTVQYLAGPNGSINGSANQTVLFDEDADTVTAEPDPGFLFLRWSDGETEAERTDTGITSDLTLTAFFEADSSMLPWLTSLHSGAIDLFIVGPSEIMVDWEPEPDISYDVYVADTASTPVSAALFLENVMPPLSIDALVEGEPVYIALFVEGEPIAWSSTVPRTLGVNGTVLAQEIDAFGNRYVGGGFSRVLLNQAYATALPQVAAAGSLSSHPLAIAEINGEVRAIAEDSLGGLYIAGDFTAVGGEPRSGLAHIDVSGQVTDWAPSVLGQVNALILLANGDVFIGGEFSDAEGVPRENLAAFDSDGMVLPWGPKVNGPVYAFLPLGDALYIGGDFSVVDDEDPENLININRHNLAAIDIDGTVQPWDARTNGPVYALAVSAGRIFVGGDFSETRDGNGGLYAKRSLGVFLADSQESDVVRLPGLETDGVVYSLTLSSTRAYIGGDFTLVKTSPTNSLPRTNVVAVTEALGVAQVESWDPELSGPVRSILAIDDLVYIGGNSLDGTQSLLAFDEDGDRASWTPGVQGSVSVLAPYGETLFVGGDFNGLGDNRERNNLAAFGPQGELLDWNPNADGVVRVLSQLNDDLYIGGDFVQVSGESRRRLAAVGLQGTAFDGQLLSWDPVVDGSVMAMDVENGIFYVGGNFGAAGSDDMPRSNLAAFDLSGMLQSWAPQANAPVRAVLATPSLIYIGGEFTEVDSESRLGLAGIDADGLLSLDWAPETNGSVNALMAFAGDVYVGGEFSVVDGEPREGLAAFDTNGDLLLWSPSVNGAVLALAEVSGDIYVGGDFSEANAEVRTNLAAFDDTGDLLIWAPEVNAPVRSLQGFASEVYAGGDFVQVGDIMMADWRQGLAIFDLGGSLQSR